jgi:RNA polymerase sigma-70 factor (ECF subfamily)
VSPPTFDDVYTEYFPFVWRSAEGLGVPASALDDVVQEVFLVVYRKLPSFEARSSLRTWVYGVVLHTARRHRRTSQRKRLDQVEDLAVAGETLEATGPGPHESIEQAEALRQLDALLEQLDDEKREVFVLAELEQLTAPEIAEILGANVNTIYARIRAAKRAFEQALARLHAAPPRRAP